jgi:uncharacterized delta-60 repeat protein
MQAYGLRRIFISLISLMIALLLSIGTLTTSLSASDQLDPTFDGDGKMISTLGNEAVSGEEVIIQADQKILVTGSAFIDGDWDFTLLRYCVDGSLDDGINCGTPGFGNLGRVVTDFGGNFHDSAMDAVLQPDGKIVVVGTSSSYPQFDMAVARYNPNGSLDTTFDGDGLVKVDLQNSDERGYAVALQPDGKIIVGGVSYISTWGDFALARLCANGALDDGINCGSPGFTSKGWVTTDFSGSSDWISGLAVYDGKIIAGGSGGDRDFAVARYLSNGNLDTGFDSDGKRTVSLGSGWDYGQDVVVQSDGKIILAGGGYAGDWNTDFGLARFNTNGSLDVTFDGDGKVLTEFFGNSDRILSVTLQGDAVLAVGYAMHCYGEDLAVARYNTNGSLDTAFDGDGKATTDFGGYYDAASSVAIQANGQVVVAGYTGEDPGGEGIALARYNTNGSLDGTFDGDGKVHTDNGGYHLGYSVAAVSGKIFVAGWSNNSKNQDFALVRFEDNGSLDTGFAAMGMATADFSAGDDMAVDMAVQTDGKFVLAGRTLQGSNNDFALARFCPNGKLDDGVNCGSLGFGTGGKIVTDFGGNDYSQSLLIQPDGKIVVSGYTRSCPSSDFAIARYNANGSLDTSFDVDGKVTVDFTGQWDDANGVARQPDGKLVVVGMSRTTYSNSDFALVRLCSNGMLDNGTNCGSQGFGSGGKTTTDFIGDSDRAVVVLVQPDNKIVVAGEARTSSNDFALARYCPDGKLDDGVNCGLPGFGISGKTTTDFFEDWETLTDLILLPRGEILAAGTASRDLNNSGWDEDFALALYTPEGSLNNSFSTDGLETVDFGATDESGLALAWQVDSKFLMSGASAGHLAMARFIYPKFIYLPLVKR